MKAPSKNALDCSGEQRKVNQFQTVNQFRLTNTVTIKKIFIDHRIIHKYGCRHIASFRDFGEVFQIDMCKFPFACQDGPSYYSTNQFFILRTQSLILSRKDIHLRFIIQTTAISQYIGNGTYPTNFTLISIYLSNRDTINNLVRLKEYTLGLFGKEVVNGK